MRESGQELVGGGGQREREWEGKREWEKEDMLEQKSTACGQH